jgi:hypothetical protein
MRGMGCMTYHGKKDVEVAGLWLEKKKKRRKRERVINQK